MHQIVDPSLSFHATAARTLAQYLVRRTSMQHRSFALVISACLCLAGVACEPTSDDSTATATGGSGGKAGSGGSGGKGGSAGSGGTTERGGSGGAAGRGGSGSGGDKAGGSGGAAGTTSSGGTGGGGAVGSGGSAGSGGKGDTAGSGGGTAGRSGGAGGRGGASGTGGSAGSGGSTGGEAGSTGSGNCTFTQQSSLSTKIATVGIVTWSTTLPSPTEASIDFGLTTSYGFTAPVDLKAQSYRTLLLGMKQSKTYNYRIKAKNSSGECTSGNYTITTGTLASGMSKITVSNKSTASPLAGGFLILGQFTSGGGSSGSPAYILDADNEYVWAYSTGGDAAGVTMDLTGTHMWVNSVNVGGGFGGGGSGSATVHRITMDGLTDENLSSKFSGQNHQLTVFSPDGTTEMIAFYAYGSNGCDDIKEYNVSTGAVKTIANSGTAIGGASACHCNNIQYSKEDDTLVFSELDNQAVAKVKRSDGSTVWVLNGGKPTLTGDTWKGGEHGIHILGVDKLLVFNNNSTVNMGGAGSGGGDGSGSIAIELKLDLSAKKVTKAWSYKANPKIDNQIMGDLQRMPNGNTIIAFSTKGVVQEVSSSGTLLQELSWPAGGQFGYMQKRPTLYGPPPR
jgi:hypothetical protein